MRVKVFTDKNLHRVVAGGWNLQALAEGKVATLGGRIIEVDVQADSTVKTVKKALEDKEGLKMEDMSIRTTTNRVLEDDEKLANHGLSSQAKRHPCLVLLMTKTEPDPQAATQSPQRGLAQRERSQPTQTVTVARDEAAPQRRAGGSDASERDEEQGSAASQTLTPFEGAGHTLGARRGGRSGGDSAEERRRAALAAAEARMRQSGQ